MADRQSQSVERLVEPLTRREHEILGLLARGHTGPEIARALTIALSSVRTHQQNLYGKLGVNSRRAALTRAHALGLLETTAPAGPARPPAGPAQRHNLPMELTRFFGRELEIGQVRELLDEYRLVTITGPGGVGKTRLALRVAEGLLEHFGDGVWLVELAALSDPALVAQEVAHTMGARGGLSGSVVEALIGVLAQRQVLLVLDNCEHLSGACARLAEGLLRACQTLVVLATSREPLDCAGEAIFPAPSLPFPATDQPLSLDQSAAFASLRLLADRARMTVPEFQVTPENVAALARICRRLDGVPLAIEMAAARLNTLSAEQLASRLDDAFAILAGGRRTALPRQQTLRATLDWSFDLLTPEERLLLQRLAVFAGGHTLEAAEAVCADEALPAGRIVGVLASLVAKSMVVVDRQADEPSRYRLLEVVRQYASEKLAAVGDRQRWHTRHCEYFLAFFETNLSKLNSHERPRWLRLFRADHENRRQALDWSFSDSDDITAGPRLVVAMPGVWSGLYSSYEEYMGWHQKAVDWCERQADMPPTLHAIILGRACHPLASNDPPGALRWAERAVAMSRNLGSTGQETLLRCLMDLSWVYVFDLSQFEQAQAIIAEVDALFGKLAPEKYSSKPFQGARSELSFQKAELAKGLRQYRDARAFGLESIQLRNDTGDRWGTIHPRITVGDACLRLGEYDQAREHYLAALRLSEEIGNLQKACELQRLGRVEWRCGRLEQALNYCYESLREADKLLDRNITAGCLDVCAGIAAEQGKTMRTATLSGAARALWERQGRKPEDDTSLDTLLPGWRDRSEHDGIAQAYAAGQALDAYQAAAYALGDTVVSSANVNQEP